MTLQDLQNQALRLPVGDRWRLVQSLLRSIQQETPVSTLPLFNTSALADLEPWTQSLVGVIQLGFEDSTDSYV
ncbi:MAG: hypothetical protein AAGJ80_18530, partial [Cyanobacteria bacterium J06553_1]